MPHSTIFFSGSQNPMLFFFAKLTFSHIINFKSTQNKLQVSRMLKNVASFSAKAIGPYYLSSFFHKYIHTNNNSGEYIIFNNRDCPLIKNLRR